MQSRTKEMPSATNRPRKTTSNSEASANSNGAQALRATSENGGSPIAKQSEEQRSSGQVSSEEIAKRAYLHWEAEGKPHGKDLEHWVRAKSELERNRP